MTVKQSRDQENAGSDLLKPKEFSPIEDSMESEKALAAKKFSDDRCLNGKLKVRVELETESESNGSSEETESPRSVTKLGQWRTKRIAYVHNQILKIREEDSHIGEEIGELLSAKDKLPAHSVASSLDLMLFSRPMLPSSPLSGKTTPFKTVH
ncbi:uncharacterized protein LOC132315896 [Cornus florida]|uniref:uncharacterized protein LOC132315896 n=1 Tax=Cornus florida TaxID=4283 RepID=UPI0028A066FA|nr:uncharacterized protein LOC132315896 [Cornus florida]